MCNTNLHKLTEIQLQHVGENDLHIVAMGQSFSQNRLEALVRDKVANMDGDGEALSDEDFEIADFDMD